MTDMTVSDKGYDFTDLHAAMQRYVDQEILAGVSSAVLVGRELVDLHCAGWADREANAALSLDHIFRVFSNTKLVTSCAALLLYEEGCFQLDDPIEEYIPQLGSRQVLKPNASDPSDTEPAAGSITIRHLMTHSSGLSYELLGPDRLIYELYSSNKVDDPTTRLSDMIEVLAGLPLVFHPGTSWEYSVATDALARLVEIVSGQSFRGFLRARIFDPIGMIDTDFWVPPEKRARLTTYYAGVDLANPMEGGLTRLDDYPYPDAYLKPFPRQSGGIGLVSTLPDMVALIRALLPGDGMLLRPETMALVTNNQLPDGLCIRFPAVGDLAGKGHGLASAVSMTPLPNESTRVVGEYYWGGLAGTKWWVSPNHNLAGVVMTQRHMSFAHPFAAELKAAVYGAVVD